MALGVLRALREQGLRVPQDVSVTGFDNIKLSEFCSPALTTLHIPRESIGKIIIETLAPDPTQTEDCRPRNRGESRVRAARFNRPRSQVKPCCN